MRHIISALAICVALGGCVTSKLKDISLNQGETITDFQYRMVLDNLAMFRVQPNSLPWHVVLSSGTAQLDESASPSFTYQWAPELKTLEIAPSLDLTVNWQLTPISSGPMLKLIHDRYQTAAAEDSFDKNFSEATAPPAEGPYGHFGNRYVFPKNMGVLVDLILNIDTDITNEAKQEGASFQVLPSPGVALTPRH